MCDTHSHGSDHLWLIWKESIQNCRCYRADTAAVTDGRTDGVKPIYPPTTSLLIVISCFISWSIKIKVLLTCVANSEHLYVVCFVCISQLTGWSAFATQTKCGFITGVISGFHNTLVTNSYCHNYNILTKTEWASKRSHGITFIMNDLINLTPWLNVISPFYQTTTDFGG